MTQATETIIEGWGGLCGDGGTGCVQVSSFSRVEHEEKGIITTDAPCGPSADHSDSIVNDALEWNEGMNRYVEKGYALDSIDPIAKDASTAP